MNGSDAIRAGSTVLVWLDPDHPTAEDPDVVVDLFPDVASAVSEAFKVLHDKSADQRLKPLIFYHDFQTNSDNELSLYEAMQRYILKH